ncbi:hexitol phosphatase HxpB [Pigmentibacter sp. JX0631]|uniref:hexitol phosphatase HxpB n=1 Tax=Pigmentibacter sp. JX0631 TaxID=2976982 RepID=UPI002469583A|nr:hexitol phosphatase HxpB [Pigmentibacter sp. JX0631]WGL60714.1 hexitol phosphatase HxpB [Pigmentibacter sp. JX0631]
MLEINKTKSVIFDMDGVIVDSEPLWLEAELQIFKSFGLILTPKDCELTKGMRLANIVDFWYKKRNWNNVTQEEIGKKLEAKLIELIAEKATAKEGLFEVLIKLKQNNISLAICSSSPLSLIKAVCNKLNLFSYFDILQSAENCEFGKPHPEPYISTMLKLNTTFNKCFVIEDTVTGAISAKAARMKVIAIPEGENYFSSKYDFCDYKFKTLSEIIPYIS